MINQRKLTLLRAILQAHDLDSVVVQRSQNFAWLTDGASSYVNIASDLGAAALVVTRDGAHLVCDNIERPRLHDEEGLTEWRLESDLWTGGRVGLIQKVARGRVGADSPFPGATDLAAPLANLRYQLDAEEMERLRIVARATARALEGAARQVQPGMSENEIAGLVAGHAYATGVVPIVNLVATDERCFRYRHPLPTARRLERYAMLAICGRQSGLIASATRLVHFGEPSEDLQRRMAACAAVDAGYFDATRQGNTLADVFLAGVDAYARYGFPDEWKHHHQGGLTGYQTREMLATPSSTLAMAAGMAFAWNPSIAGVKSEDTILLTGSGVSILTDTGEWPYRQHGNWRRPEILIR